MLSRWYGKSVNKTLRGYGTLGCGAGRRTVRQVGGGLLKLRSEDDAVVRSNGVVERALAHTPHTVTHCALSSPSPSLYSFSFAPLSLSHHVFLLIFCHIKDYG